MHVSKTGRKGTKKSRLMSVALQEDLKYMRGYGIVNPSAQIFVTGPRNFADTLTADETQKIRALVDDNDINLVIHGAYVDHPWSKKDAAIGNIKKELRIAAAIGATGVVVHLAAGAANDTNLKYVIEELSKLEEPIRTNTTLWLEINTAKPSDFTFETPAKVQELFKRVSECPHVDKLNIGLCIDTAHLFACGVALDTADAAQTWLDALPDVPVMLHLNDSASALASGIDRHEVLCKGNIWKAYHPTTGHLPTEDSGLVAILNWAESNDIMTILERNNDDLVHDLIIIQQLGYFTT